MTRFQTLLAAAAALVAFPALAHDGVHVVDAYARVTGSIGGSAAVFFTVENHQVEGDRLITATTDVADMAAPHTHSEDANGVMQMREVEGGFVIPANEDFTLARGGDHIMLMGLKKELKDGDIFQLTLSFEKAGDVVVDVSVDNARKADAAMEGAMESGMDHMQHDMAGNMAPDTTGLTDAEAVTSVLKAQFETPDAPLTVDPVVVDGDHALASWAQGDKGGRALLERHDGVWTVVLCGGPDLRMPAFLTEHGVTAAETLSNLFNAAEDKLGAEKVALGSSFEGVVMVGGHSH